MGVVVIVLVVLLVLVLFIGVYGFLNDNLRNSISEAGANQIPHQSVTCSLSLTRTTCVCNPAAPGGSDFTLTI